MRPIAKLFCVFTLMSANLSCSVNILENFATKNNNEALYVDAKMLMNSGDYAGALAKIDAMTDTYAADRKVVALKASAYGGLCGLNFLAFVDALGNMGSTRLFPMLLSAFRAGATTNTMDYCLQAEDTIESIGAIGARTSDENMLMVLISFAKIGNILSFYADSDQDGTVTAGYNSCSVGGARTAGGNLSDVDARQLGTGITLAIANIAAVSSSVNLGNASLAAVDQACTDLSAINPAFDFCSITDPTAFTANHLKGIRSILKEDQSVGLGSNCSGDLSTCNCP